MSKTPARTRGRGGARAARRAERAKPRIEQIPYISRKIPIYEILNEEGLETIEDNAETILEIERAAGGAAVGRGQFQRVLLRKLERP